MNFSLENPNFAEILDTDMLCNSQPISLPSSQNSGSRDVLEEVHSLNSSGSLRPPKHTGQQGEFRSIEEICPKYQTIFTYSYFNLVQSRVIEDALYSDKSMVVCAPTGSGKTVVFEMAIAQLLMDLEEKNYTGDFKIIYMAPVKAVCTERLTEWYPKLTKLGLLCIEVTGDTDVEFPQLKPYRVIITTPEKWDMLTRRWRDYRGLVEVVKLFLIDEVHILNDNVRGPVLEAVVSRMKTIESSVQSAHRIEQLQKQYSGNNSKDVTTPRPRIRFMAISATVNNPEDVAAWLGAADKPAVYYNVIILITLINEEGSGDGSYLLKSYLAIRFGDECRPVKLTRIVEGYPCPQGTSIFKFDIILNYKLWPIIQKYHNGKPTLIFCNTRKSVTLTAEALSRGITINFNPEQKANLTALASTLKNKKLQALVLNGVGCHHAGLLFEERMNIERAFRNRHLPILITTTTLAMGVNLPAHLVIIKNTQQYVNGAYQEYSISTILQMVGRAGRPQFDTEATAVIMTRMADKARYQALVEGTEPLQSFLHKRLTENLNSEAALGTVADVAQCVQWVNSTFLSVRASKDPRRYLALPQSAPPNEISKKIEEMCVKAMNRLASSGLIVMDETSCIESTEAGKLMSMYYLDLETMKLIMKIEGSETLERLLWLICESHELSDMHLRVDERRCLNTLNRSNTAATIRFPMKGKISSRQMKLNCVIQAVLGCLPIPDPSLNQEAMKIMRIALRVCKCLVAYTSRSTSVSQQPKTFSAVLNSIVLAKCLSANLWENSPYVSKQLRGIGPAFSMLLASAGKTNFLLLEESHPRDLERIMNKGPPAGNVIRKQISLLPKYQISITPIDKDRVHIQLMLLNQVHLSENLEHFTAGINHKSYIVVGDTENNLLYLITFKDTDLIKIYDGCISCEVTRKHSHEHKLVAHCVSGSFAGIDVQAEHLFLEIGTYHRITDSKINVCKDDSRILNVEKNTPYRKRKINTNVYSESVKEKTKCDNNLLKKFKYLKELCEKNSKEMLGDIPKNLEMSSKIKQNLSHLKFSATPETVVINNINTNDSFGAITVHDPLNDGKFLDYLDDESQVNDILSEIENEMGKTIAIPLQVQEQQQQAALYDNQNKRDLASYINDTTKTHKKKMKCNFNILEKDVNSNDENDVILINGNVEGFTNTVKFKIDQYIQNTKNTKSTYKDIDDLLQIETEDVINIENDRKSSSDVVVGEILTDCAQVQSGSNLYRDKSRDVDRDSALIQNVEKKSDEEYLEVSTQNNVLTEVQNNEIKNIIECYKINGRNCEKKHHVPSIYDANLTIILPSQENNSVNSKNINDSIDIHKDDIEKNIFGSNINHEIDLTNGNFFNGTNHLRVTTLPAPVKQVSLGLDNCLEYTSQVEISKTQSNLDIKNNINENNEHSVTVPSSLVSDMSDCKNLRMCRETQFSDIHKSYLINSSKNKNISSIAPINSFKNSYICGTSSNENSLNGSEKNDSRIEKYCFRSTKLNIFTENNNKHVVKIISNLKIDLDITDILSIKKDNIEQEFNHDERSNPSYTNMIEPDINVLDTEINDRSMPRPENTLENNEMKDHLKKNVIETSNTISLQTLNAKIHDEIPNNFSTKSFNNIENIFKKYRTLISSRSESIAAFPVIKPVNNDIITEPTVDKPKRRYKISDINNLQASWLKKNIEDDFDLAKFQDKIIEKGQGEVNHDYDLIDVTGSSDNCMDIYNRNLFLPSELSDDRNNNSQIYIEMGSPTRNAVDLPRIDLKRAMLDPRALLEHCNNNNDIEEIISPPPEFADDTNLSSPHYQYLPSLNDAPKIYHYDIQHRSLHCETIDAINICHVFGKVERELMPADHLTSEYNLQDHSKSYLIQNINNCKVTRNNSGGNRTLFSKNTKVKLNEFKYKCKNTMKLK